MIARLAVLSIALTVALTAADFWTKPAADWTDKELDQMLTNSPWADRMAVETGQRGPVGNADDKGGPIQGNLTAPIVLVWRTSLPIRQAFARRANGPVGEAPANTSILLVSGIPAMFRADIADPAKVMAESVLKVKGKADIHPTEVQVAGGAPAAPPNAPNLGQDAAQSDITAGPPAGGRGGRGGGGAPPAAAPGGIPGGRGFGGAPINLLLVFPKNAGLTVDDKEVEFVTKIGKMNIRKKFKLKDMVVNGKLEM
jgi:hypothetical protein